jgi:extradiol dioxygenase family protein
MATPFHFAFPIKNLEATRKFYVDLLGCTVGRRAGSWIDFNFFGNQLTVNVNKDAVYIAPFFKSVKSAFPPYHFGVILPWKEWHELEARLVKAGADFLIEPSLVFEGEPGEQKIMFIKDPSGYSIEFKSFEDPTSVFKSE